MGLGTPPNISPEIRKRAYITIIRRNWHLLPYEQMMTLLQMTEEELAFTLREDDFLYIKLGSMKPKCAPLTYVAPDEATLKAEKSIAASVKRAFPNGPAKMTEPLFQFVTDLSEPIADNTKRPASRFSPRFCSSYFALFGDPLLEEDIDPYPDGYLARLASSGVDSIWMHVVLYQLAEFPWDTSMSSQYKKRLVRLNALVERARDHGIGIYLYMNEPRAMPNAFFTDRENLKGVTIGDHSTLCTSVPEVREYITSSVETICNAVPNLKGFFTITASENPTNCWSHNRGAECPRCSITGPAKSIAGVNAAIQEGIQRTNNETELIAWDWGWRDDWALDAIAQLPEGVSLMSVSEWSISIERGGVNTTIGEYSISTIGPGPRATKHWKAARARGLKTIAKIQAGNTWEIAAVPYIPAVANVAQHAANLRDAQLDGIMLGWSLGGYPSSNLQVVAEMSAIQDDDQALSPDEAMLHVAQERYGINHAEAVVEAWKACSVALSEFPFHGSVVYRAPLQVGPANLLWNTNTNYASTMVGIPYDDFRGWRGIYPENVFIGQFEKMAKGFGEAHSALRDAIKDEMTPALQGELDVIETVAIHYQSIAQQSRFIQLREQLKQNENPGQAQLLIDNLEDLIEAERELALRLHAIQIRDSRIGYESSNHYFYVPMDLAEKVLNCDALLREWVSKF
ncbi:MAG TPA: hypothetical protein EYN96_07010 [Candidatus Hydrogenedentes bacterium]|nr:hypothetical protein [Candidatus Hydrogenedentota bacterium]